MKRAAAIMIPGAWEPRVRRAAAVPIGESGPQLDQSATAAAASDPNRLERQREGGGAPGQRRVGPPTILTRLWRSLLHPTHLPDLWRRPNPVTR